MRSSGRIHCANLFFDVIPVHFVLVFLLALLTFLDLSLDVPLGLCLLLGDLLGVQQVLLGGSFVQDLDALLAVPAGSCLQGSAQVVVQSKDVGPKVDEERDAVDVAIAGGVVQGCVPPDVTLVWIAPGRENSTQ